jgi:hypothetical protein
MTLVELIAAGKQMPDIIDLALTGDGRARVFIAKNYPDTWQDMQSVKIIPACIHCGMVGTMTWPDPSHSLGARTTRHIERTGE